MHLSLDNYLANGSYNCNWKEFQYFVAHLNDHCASVTHLALNRSDLRLVTELEWQNFLQALVKCEKLKFFTLNSTKLSAEQCQLLGQNFNNLKELPLLNLENNAGFAAGQHFSFAERQLSWQIFAYSQQFKNINWHETRLNLATDQQVQAFVASMLVVKEKITHIHLNENNLDKMTVPQLHILCHGIIQCTNLDTLSVYNNNLGDMSNEQWQIFLQAISQSKNLKKLILSCNNLGKMSEQQWQEFCLAISQCENLKVIHLSHNALVEMPEQCWKPFCETLAKLKLKSLGLCNNNIGEISEENWELFFAMLGQQEDLQELFISSNRLESASLNKLSAFKQALAKLTKLKNLFFTASDLKSMPNDRWQAFWEAVGQCLNLEDLDLSNCFFFYCPTILIKLELLESALVNLKKIKRFSLRGNEIGSKSDEVVEKIISILSGFSDLESIDLTKNHLYLQWDLFIPALKNCKNLKNINLAENALFHLQDNDWQNLGEIINNCMKIEHVDLSRNDSPIGFGLVTLSNMRKTVRQVHRGLYFDFNHDNLTSFTNNYANKALLKTWSFFSWAFNVENIVAAKQVLRFLDAEDVCRLQLVCSANKKNALEIKNFVQSYFKQQLSKLGSEDLHDMKYSYMLRTKNEPVNLEYNMTIPQELVDGFIDGVKPGDKKHTEYLFSVNNGQDHFSKFCKLYSLDEILNELIKNKAIFDVEEDWFNETDYCSDEEMPGGQNAPKRLKLR